MIQLCVAGISALLEPSTAASATAAFAGLVGGALDTPTATAHRGQTRHRGCFCGQMRALT